MKLLITLVIAIVLTGCQANTTKQQLKDNTTTNVTNNANQGHHYGWNNPKNPHYIAPKPKEWTFYGILINMRENITMYANFGDGDGTPYTWNGKQYQYSMWMGVKIAKTNGFNMTPQQIINYIETTYGATDVTFRHINPIIQNGDAEEYQFYFNLPYTPVKDFKEYQDWVASQNK
ncbi:hypothetical protein NDK43_06910 [Neobacillus pocheonensis]|uniref:DUF5067 domain-containing protein n=1 Tax=Neobacillus pocheonensis TaxID=363869 RepID=A0ABT0W792_9BACI|nr:hypothetical protein [Neobacillus pocheonensis]